MRFCHVHGDRGGKRLGEETCQEGQLVDSQKASSGTSGSQSSRLRNQIFQGMESQIDLCMCESINAPKTDAINQTARTWKYKETGTHRPWGHGGGQVIFYKETRILERRWLDEHGPRVCSVRCFRWFIAQWLLSVLGMIRFYFLLQPSLCKWCLSGCQQFLPLTILYFLSFHG